MVKLLLTFFQEENLWWKRESNCFLQIFCSSSCKVMLLLLFIGHKSGDFWRGGVEFEAFRLYGNILATINMPPRLISTWLVGCMGQLVHGKPKLIIKHWICAVWKWTYSLYRQGGSGKHIFDQWKQLLLLLFRLSMIEFTHMLPFLMKNGMIPQLW